MGARAITKKIQLILNGKAAGNDAFRTAIVQQWAVGHRIKVRVTRKEGDARRFAAEAGDGRLARNGGSEVWVFVAGGDVTLNKLVPGLMALPKAARPALGVLPLGTAND